MWRYFKNGRGKSVILAIAYFVAWWVGVALFYPQTGYESIGLTAGTVLLFGYTWIIPITLLIIYFTNDYSLLRALLRNNYFLAFLMLSTIVVLFFSYSHKFSNDLFFSLCWALVGIWILSLYFKIKLW